MSALVTPEGYADLCQTALTAPYTAGAGSITVSSTGSPFPQVQQFHFAIKDQTTNAVKAVGKATAITSGTVWAVTMTTDANCASGDILQLVLATDAMDQIRKDMNQFGTFANMPSTTGQKQGNRYICTDIPFEFYFDGAAWVLVPWYGVIASNVVATSQSTSSTTYTDLASLDSSGSFTLPATMNVIVHYAAYTNGINSASEYFANIINLDGADVTGSDFLQNTGASGGANYFNGIVYETSLAAGSHTIKIRHAVPNGGTGIWVNRLLTILTAPQ